ncbi:hypothetical protein GGR54DRAFT_612016 [Hypoxylon sp. NC1633]|nr:hypothetical protein GGR54DRAFT_612016 [Hypoxylon sp. NC1633]
MAAPASKTIGDLNGKWVLNKTLSDPVDSALALQGISWLVRKAIGAATVTLEIKQYRGAPKPPSESEELATHVDIQQVATAGIKGTAENRCLDHVFREHRDWLFGRVRGRTRFVTAAELAALVAPDSGAARKDGFVADDFLARDWLEGADEEKGPQGESHILSLGESMDADWTALQAWGFQDVLGERRYVRNVVVADGDKFENLKMVYDYVPE